jgi:predicted RNase H-like HicB family nuclease
MSNPYKIEAFWDQEAEVWVAESQDILGLVTEAETLDQLTHKLKQIIPNLLMANHGIIKNDQQSIAFELIAHRQELIHPPHQVYESPCHSYCGQFCQRCP